MAREKKADTGFESLSFQELKAECKKQGLSGSGNKASLLARLQEPVAPSTPDEPESPKADKEPKGYCGFCNRVHSKTIDGLGINHEPFDKGGKAEIMFDNLCDQPKKALFVPFDGGEQPGAVAFCQLNGFRVNILKGTSVEVPEQIFDVITESMETTAAIPSRLLTLNPYTGRKENALLSLRGQVVKDALNE